jgi:hypothetical protein
MTTSVNVKGLKLAAQSRSHRNQYLKKQRWMSTKHVTGRTIILIPQVSGGTQGKDCVYKNDDLIHHKDTKNTKKSISSVFKF